jgi:hypothetical protein
MRNQEGFMGCGNLIIAIWIIFMLGFVGLIMLNRNLFYVPPEKEVFTSRVAARRCRQKLEMFNNNDYIKTISLNELEINSALQEEFSQGQHESFLYVNVEMEPEKIKFEGSFILVELIPETIRSILFREDKRQPAKEESRRIAVIQVTSKPLIEESGTLLLNPQKLVIGKQNFPPFMIKLIQKIKPKWFTFQISPKIKAINIRENELELVKR